nr:hypothetical protein [uncultured Duganella sp.]
MSIIAKAIGNIEGLASATAKIGYAGERDHERENTALEGVRLSRTGGQHGTDEKYGVLKL